MLESEIVETLLSANGFTKVSHSDAWYWKDGPDMLVFQHQKLRVQIMFFTDTPVGERYPFGIYEHDTLWVIQPCDWYRLVQYLLVDLNRCSCPPRPTVSPTIRLSLNKERGK